MNDKYAATAQETIEQIIAALRFEHIDTEQIRIASATQIISRALERAALEGAIEALENTQPGDYQALRVRLSELDANKP